MPRFPREEGLIGRQPSTLPACAGREKTCHLGEEGVTCHEKLSLRRLGWLGFHTEEGLVLLTGTRAGRHWTLTW